MARSKSKPTSDTTSKTDDKDGSSKKKAHKQDGTRETFESIVVAFILAFLFRAFEAEAFVIPTGSMAPTLFGRHKEATCNECGFRFVFGASDEMDDATGLFNPMRRIESAICPNCRFENSVRDLPVFKGDRILVNKFPYEFADPQRWDVPVFKYPEKPTTNYIKRMVGLPNETLVIKRGDVYRVEEDRSVGILRKKPSKQRALQIPVHDNNHLESRLHAKGWPKRWAAMQKSQDDSADEQSLIAGWAAANSSWDEDDDGRSFSLKSENSQDGKLKWLRYRHYVPDEYDWEAALGSPDGPDVFTRSSELDPPKPQLITDFCGYNTYRGGHGVTDDDCFWVGDLTLVCGVEILKTESEPELVLELNEGIRCYRIRIDLLTGKARLISVLRFGGEEEEELLSETETSFSGVTDAELRFTNVDDRLCLWIDGDLVDFGDAASCRIDETLTPSPQDDDLTPVGIAVKGATASVRNLVIQRDIYYRASRIDNDDFDRFTGASDEEHPYPHDLRRALTSPAKWYEVYSKHAREAKFVLGDDEYLMLGDNSPRSQDSRVWPNARGALHRHAVPRSALVGRAFYIYWPHGIPFMNGGVGYPAPSRFGYHREMTQNGVKRSDYPDTRFPFYPNFWRMMRIR